tara:strand:+ start:1453 stop:2721 length:1269 start_codon:yes stop_codon:yes gene_type:complete
MNIGIIGNGGREHSLCFKLKQSPLVNKIFCIPGNGGTSEIVENLEVNYNDFPKLAKIISKKKIDLIFVGPEEPLVNGIVDFFKKKEVKIIGPSRSASKLEGSKVFMKNFCKKFKIPTAKYIEIVSYRNLGNKLNKFNLPIVVKSDGLAAGKGVTIFNNISDAKKEIKLILNGKFKTSKKVLVEEFLEGEEASYFVLTDGKNYLPIGTAQDHKRIGENDTGPNTGGMGAYSPSYLITKSIEKKILKKIIEPTISGMKKMRSNYIGILYAGLMINKSEPKLIEYNIRFGDPECQVLMMRLKNDLADLFKSIFNNTLQKKRISWTKECGITVVAASKGYPNKFKRKVEIKNINKFKNTNKKQLFHAGTIRDKNGKVYSMSGRVLNSTVISNSLKFARKKANKILEKLNWKNKYFRRDIGNKFLDK